jgi:hypothetical protein
MPDCINLKNLAGDPYKVAYEESYYTERSRHTVEDPWLMMILCQHGHIYPQGGELLAVSTDKRGGVARRIAQLPFVTVLQDGSDGINATFPVNRFDDVAEIVKPRKRRRLSPEQRAACTERLSQFRPEPQRQARNSDPERAQGGLEGSRHLTGRSGVNSGRENCNRFRGRSRGQP